jgi:hypothetical protein
MLPDGNPLFREEQRFRQPWLWGVLALSTGTTLVLFAYGMVRQLLLGEPWGDRPMSDAALALVGASVILVDAGLLLLMWSARLTTEVRTGGLYLRFFPFHRTWQRIPFEEILSSEARTYNPIGEYGGWGIRYGLRGKAYNVSGDRGVMLELAGGKTLLVGSQRADELAAAIRQAAG